MYVGTAGTTSDTAEVTQLITAGTAIADTCWIDAVAIVQGPLGGSCQIQWTVRMTHNLFQTGFSTVSFPSFQGTFTIDSTVSGLIFGLGISPASVMSVNVASCVGETKNL